MACITISKKELTKPLAKIAVLFWCALNRSIYQISLTSLYSTIKERWRPGTRKVHGWNPVVSKKLFILNYQFKFVPKENCRKSGKMTFPFIFFHNSGKTKLKYDSVIGNAGKTVCKREKLWKTFQLFWCPKYEICAPELVLLCSAMQTPFNFGEKTSIFNAAVQADIPWWWSNSANKTQIEQDLTDSIYIRRQ